MRRNLIIIGAGGYAKSVIDSLGNKYKLVGFIDEFKHDKEHLTYPILGKSIEEIENYEDYEYFIAIGNNEDRFKWYNILKQYKLKLINVLDKSAIISKETEFGEGCFVGKMAIVNSNVKIGDNTIVNTKALIEHGCTIHSNVNISTNAVVNGDVVVKDGAFIGSSSVVNGQLTIEEWSTVGSGAVVVKNVSKNTVNVGVPARVIKVKNNEK